MENKTAMMVMIQGIDTASELYISTGHIEAYKALIPIRSLADKLLKEEKEQIIEAFDQGDYLHDVWTVTGDDYYNETYLENKTNDK